MLFRAKWECTGRKLATPTRPKHLGPDNHPVKQQLRREGWLLPSSSCRESNLCVSLFFQQTAKGLWNLEDSISLESAAERASTAE